jgi:WD40 repeat protein
MVKDDEEEEILHRHRRIVDLITVNKKGDRLLLSGCYGKVVIIWDVTTGNYLFQHANKHTAGWIYAVTIMNDDEHGWYNSC